MDFSVRFRQLFAHSPKRTLMSYFYLVFFFLICFTAIVIRKSTAKRSSSDSIRNEWLYKMTRITYFIRLKCNCYYKSKSILFDAIKIHTQSVHMLIRNLPFHFGTKPFILSERSLQERKRYVGKLVFENRFVESLARKCIYQLRSIMLKFSSRFLNRHSIWNATKP